MKYAKGDRVKAKWPGSTVFYEGVVVDTGKKDCKILFDEGSEYTIDEKNIKQADNPRTASTKKKSPSRGKVESDASKRAEARSPRKASPSRKASPARKAASPSRKAATSPSRKASPGRKGSPRRSPARTTRSKVEKESSPSSVVGQLNEKVLKVVLDDEVRKSFERANSAVRRSVERANSALKSIAEASFASITKSNVSSVSNITMRKSTRLLTLRETDKLKEATPENERIRRTRELTPMGPIKATVLENILDKEPPSRKYREFGGWLGALFWLLFTPSATIAIHMYGRFLRGGPPIQKAVRNWKTFLQPDVAALGLGFIVVQAILALLPFGRMAEGQPDKQGRLRYRCNGFFNCLLTLAAVGTFHYFKYPITRLLDKTVPLFVTGQILGLLVSFALFWKGGRAPIATLNPHGNSGIRIYDFFMGREINPRVGPWDVKMTILKTAIIATVVLNALVVVKGLEAGRAGSPTLMLSVGMQLFYYLDYLWHEKALLTSFEVMYEGTGAMAVLGYATLPFFSSIITMHVLDEKVELSPYVLGVLCVIHTIGYVVYRASNNQKSEYRRNPLNPALNHLETITTSRGRKLLASGWWGWVRHPNYSGDILMAWTWGITCGTSHWLPYLVPVTVTLFMIHRLFRNEARCYQRYDSAWELYCRRVPARLIPKVF